MSTISHATDEIILLFRFAVINHSDLFKYGPFGIVTGKVISPCDQVNSPSVNLA